MALHPGGDNLPRYPRRSSRADWALAEPNPQKEHKAMKYNILFIIKMALRGAFEALLSIADAKLVQEGSRGQASSSGLQLPTQSRFQPETGSGDKPHNTSNLRGRARSGWRA